MAGALEGAAGHRFRRRSLAATRGCRVLLPELVCPFVRAVEHLDLRPGPVERLPLLLRPRDVGRRLVLRPTAPVPPARCREEPARLPRADDPGGTGQREAPRTPRP